MAALHFASPPTAEEDGPSEAVKKHWSAMQRFLWMNEEGMNVSGTTGCQVWDQALIICAVDEAGMASRESFSFHILPFLRPFSYS